MVTWKLPTNPSTFSTFDNTLMVILGWFPTSDILGVQMHAAQSSVGNVLSILGILPPIVGFRSTMVT